MFLRDAQPNSFLAACPGAGKTYQVVGRYLARATSEKRKGIALVSFSNSAIDEARERCGAAVEALRSPHYVGTFDAFIHRFLVTPYLAARGTQPSYIEDWGELDNTEVRLPGSPRIAFRLEWFDFEADGVCTLDIERPHAGLWKAHRRLADREAMRLCSIATRRWKGLVGAGLLSCSAARVIARSLLSDHTRRHVLRERLGGRFAEIIVDEMQDCGPDELEILSLCHDSGVDLVLVADMDQSIYEFRNAVPQKVLGFASSLRRLPDLMTNRRSSPAICSINSSLRAGRIEESPLDPSEGHPVVLLIGGKSDEIRERFIGLLDDYDIDHGESIVIAHRRKDAMEIAGQPLNDSRTSDRVAKIAIATAILSNPLSTPKDKRRARYTIEMLVLHFIGLHGSQSVEALLLDGDIDQRWFKRLIAQLVATLSNQLKTGRTQFTTSLKSSLTRVEWPAGNSLSPGAIRTPRAESWSTVATMVTGNSEGTLPAGTVHSVKGQEFRAVLLRIPQNLPTNHEGSTVLDHWECDRPTEDRRVLYVGASRPSDLLVLSVPHSHGDQTARILEATCVPFVPSSISIA